MDWMQDRLDAVRRSMVERRLDALLVTRGSNLQYLANFPDGEATLFITAERANILTDFRYVGMLQDLCPAFSLVEISRSDPMPGALAALAAETGAVRLGFDNRNVSYETYFELRKALRGGGRAQSHLVPAGGLVEALRAVKTAREIAAVERAVAITDQAMAAFLARVTTPNAPEMSERQAAWELERSMRELGAEGMAFPVAVAAGPNSAIPHHASGDRILGRGEPIWVDMGARVDGYCCDMTRTFCLGNPDARFREIYGLVLEAQVATEAAMRGGAGCRSVDGVARGIIAKAGYAENFRHGTGHGVGVDIHEGPYIGTTSSRNGRLQAGNVVTVEPGVYLEGWGGARIEDLVLVTETGHRVLTQSPK